MQILRLVVFVALLLPAALLPAQGRTGRVRGVVIDSLLGDVLAGADVRIARFPRGATTDSTGRFAIDSVPPGDWTLSFSHPALDSLGVVGSTASVRVFGGASASVVLATLSFETLRARVCGGTADSLSPTVAFGNVRAADGSRVRVNVSVSWLLGSMPGESSRPGSVRTASDGERQAWVACGIPHAAWFHASMRDSTRSASAFLHMGARDLAVQDLVLSTGTARLRGTVRDRDARPVVGAHIGIEGSTWRATTDQQGAFIAPDAPNGTITLDVRAAGFAPWVGAVTGGDSVSVLLRPVATSSEDGPRGSDYLRLLQRGARAGVQVLTGAALASDSAALAALPRADTCRWWVDGRPVDREFFTAQPRWSWRALELYPRGEDAPPEYRTPGCSVALLWTIAADW